ncbi:SDR family NAD(P)-dependent oxidoreductase [Escherichia coli]|nr:SDR family NAD(P)-dependent oxidoreductase [Escherichia coli]
MTADLRKIDGIPRLLDRAVAEFGHIDILVNNAGLIRREDALEFSEKDWDDVMEPEYQERILHVSGSGETLYRARQWRQDYQYRVNALLFQAGIRVPSYTASKSGVMGVTRLMANEWAKHNINVNAIAPGYMATNNTQQLRADEQRSSGNSRPHSSWSLGDCRVT